MNGIGVLVLLALGACGGWWAAAVFRFEDKRALEEFRRKHRHWSD